MTTKLIDIAFLMGSGRVNSDVEWAAFAAVEADSFAEFNRKMRSATSAQVDQVWSIVKSTPAGKSLA